MCKGRLALWEKYEWYLALLHGSDVYQGRFNARAAYDENKLTDTSKMLTGQKVPDLPKEAFATNYYLILGYLMTSGAEDKEYSPPVVCLMNQQHVVLLQHLY